MNLLLKEMFLQQISWGTKNNAMSMKRVYWQNHTDMIQHDVQQCFSATCPQVCTFLKFSTFDFSDVNFIISTVTKVSVSS
jgi:hypothetical protein